MANPEGQLRRTSMQAAFATLEVAFRQQNVAVTALAASITHLMAGSIDEAGLAIDVALERASQASASMSAAMEYTARALDD